MSESACLARQKRASRKSGPGKMPAMCFEKCIDCAQGKAVSDKIDNGGAVDQTPDPNLVHKILKSVSDTIEINKNREKTEGGLMRKVYSDEEKQFLIDNIDSMSNKQLGERLGRSAGAISVALSNFGLKRNRNRKPAAASEPEPIAAPAKSNGNHLSIDFSDYPDILENICTAAKEEIRTPEQQVLFWLKKEVLIKRKEVK
jgi:hypothetical protein